MTKFKYTKGSENDFEGAPDWAFLKTFTGGSYFFAQHHEQGAMVLDIALGELFQVEHKVCSLGVDIIAQREPISEPVPGADGWIKWDGGDCPVEKGALVDVKLINQGVPYLSVSSCQLVWTNHHGLANIIAYRLSKPAVAKEPVWNGEGLPPVGTECEFYKHSRSPTKEWVHAKIMYVSDYTVVMQEVGEDSIGEIIHHPNTLKFRPIRSPEEIEREKAIDEIRAIIIRYIGKPFSAKYSASDLYDAGYRKVK